MKFSLHYTLQSKGSWNGLYREFLHEVVLAERRGFNAVYIGEHHFAEDGWCPSPMVALASAASVTSRIKLGTNIVVLPLHNPIKVVEDISVLDNISNGRAILGIGLGYRVEEYKAFNAPLKGKGPAYDEKISVLKALLEGRPINIGDGIKVRLYPRPVQVPRPPIWVAAKTEKAVRKAAGRGDAWIMDPVTPIAVLEERFRAYYEEVKRLGKEVEDLPLRRECFVSKDEEELERVRALVLKSYEEDYYAWGHLQDEQGRPVDPKETPFKELVDSLFDRMLIGKPDEIIEKVEGYRKRLPITELMLKLSFPGIDHRMRMNSIGLIAEEVIPYFSEGS